VLGKYRPFRFINMRHFILTPDKLVRQTDLITWGNFLQKDKSRVIGYNIIENVIISTVFVGLEGQLFETGVITPYKGMIIVNTYQTYEEALKGHRDTCWSYIDILEDLIT